MTFELTSLPRHNLYVELFSGTRTRLFNKLPETSEIYNDLNGDFTDLFEIIRLHGKEFIDYVNNEVEVIENLDERLQKKLPRLKEVYQDIKRGRFLRGDLSYITGHRRLSRAIIRELHELDSELPYIIERLRLVQFENRPMDDIIKRYDNNRNSRTVFYVDLDGLPEDVTEDELIKHLLEIKGNCILRGDVSTDNESVLEEEGWVRALDFGEGVWVNFRQV